MLKQNTAQSEHSYGTFNDSNDCAFELAQIYFHSMQLCKTVVSVLTFNSGGQDVTLMDPWALAKPCTVLYGSCDPFPIQLL